MRRLLPIGAPVIRSRSRMIYPQQILRVNRAVFIPSGMHGMSNVRRGVPEEVVAKLIAKGIPAPRARAIVARAAARVRRHRGVRAGHSQRHLNDDAGGAGLHGLGDIVADATTWITYGNDIVNRSKTGNVGAEAMKAAQNINTFLGNRGPDLQAASPETVDALDEMTDKLTKIASGQIKYDSVAGAFFDELGNAVRGEVIVGAQAVANTPKKIIKYASDEVIKPALDIIPWYVWAAGATVGAAALAKSFRLW